jgi:hypothetical protein
MICCSDGWDELLLRSLYNHLLGLLERQLECSSFTKPIGQPVNRVVKISLPNRHHQIDRAQPALHR